MNFSYKGKELKVIGFDDNFSYGDCTPGYILQLGDMRYRLEDDELQHIEGERCEFCEEHSLPDFHSQQDLCFGGEDEIFPLREEIKEHMEERWISKIKNASEDGLSYKILEERINYDTFHIVIKFDVGRITEIVFKVDDLAKIHLKEIKGILPQEVMNHVTNTIAPDLLEHNKLKIIASCSPVSDTEYEQAIKTKLSDFVLNQTLAVFGLNASTLTKDEKVDELLRVYKTKENKATLQERLKRGKIV